MNKKIACVLILLFVSVELVYTQVANPRISIPRISGSPNIDGSLSEKEWKKAAKIQEFYTFRPVDGQIASERTSVLLMYNSESLFLAFICFDPEPDKIRSTVCRRDEIFEDDYVGFFLDTFNDKRFAYQFGINPHGIQSDGFYVESVGEDLNPDFIYYSEGKRFARGYLLEIEIPFKSLRFPDSPEQTWGFGAIRRISHLDKDLIWPAISRNQPNITAQFGQLTGIKYINSGHNVEILPEFSVNQQNTRSIADDAIKNGPVEYDGGLSFKYGITSNMTLDLAVNPDFSQVEADADKIDINRRYPIYYDEKRPFFLEGITIFQTPINALYTRRIVDPLAGIKFTGQAGRFSVGVLSSADMYYGSSEYLDETANFQKLYYDPGLQVDEFKDKYKDKLSYHSAFRLKYNVGTYSNIGLLVTDKEFEDTYNRVAGIDGTIYFSNQHIFTFQGLYSQTSNFFNDKETGDPGFYASFYSASRNFNYQVFYNDLYPNFNPENGFIERSDIREGGIYLWYDFLSSTSFMQLFRPGIYFSTIYDHEQNQTDQFIMPFVTMQLKGQTEMTLQYMNIFEQYYGIDFRKEQMQFVFSNKTLSWFFTDLSVIAGSGIYYDGVYEGILPFLGYAQYITSTTVFKPFSRWSLEFLFNNYLFNGWENGIRYRKEQDIYRLKSVFQFTRELYLRLILQHNDFYKDIDANILFSYEFAPGTIAYIGYSDYFQRDISKRYQSFENGYFAKFSYLFRF